MAKTYEPIATYTFPSASSSYTFSSIPSIYTDLVLVAVAGSSGAGNLILRFNSDSGTNYSLTYLYGSGSAASSGRVTNNNCAQFQGISNNLNGNQIIQIMNYSNSTTYKTAISKGGAADLATSSWVNMWRNTAAITSITVSDNSSTNIITGSTFTLYGIKAA